MIITYEQYDELTEKFEHITAKRFWPSPVTLEKMEQDPERWILFACYLYDFGEPPKTKAEQYSNKSLQEFIHNNLTLVDSVLEAGVAGY